MDGPRPRTGGTRETSNLSTMKWASYVLGAVAASPRLNCSFRGWVAGRLPPPVTGVAATSDAASVGEGGGVRNSSSSHSNSNDVGIGETVRES